MKNLVPLYDLLQAELVHGVLLDKIARFVYRPSIIRDMKIYEKYLEEKQKSASITEAKSKTCICFPATVLKPKSTISFRTLESIVMRMSFPMDVPEEEQSWFQDASVILPKTKE